MLFAIYDLQIHEGNITLFIFPLRFSRGEISGRFITLAFLSRKLKILGAAARRDGTVPL